MNRIGVIGAGVMGQAILKGMLSHSEIQSKQLWAAVHSEASQKAIEKNLKIKCVTDFSKELKGTDVLFLCVKPKQTLAVLESLSKSGISKDTLVISIAAGVTLDQLESALSVPCPVVRAMPNTPCLVNQGMTVICGGSKAQNKHIQIAKKLFESVGLCLEMDESYFNAVTGLSGSGPAYLYLIMEALADGAVRVGLPRKVAMSIVSQTVLGSAVMVQKSDRHPAALRDEVTTPAGCTSGALLILEDGKIRSVLARAVEKAAEIAKRLGS